MANDITVAILRSPDLRDWQRCQMLAYATEGKDANGRPTKEWMRKMLKCQHSPIRTLMFTIGMRVPYYVSTHFVRHKIGVEHFVQSQRNDRQSNYDRELAPQNEMVFHIMDINAEQLMFMANRRLCAKADKTTRYVMFMICRAVEETCSEFTGCFKPMCEKMHECPEFKSCGHWDRKKMDYAIQIMKEC